MRTPLSSSAALVATVLAAAAPATAADGAGVPEVQEDRAAVPRAPEECRTEIDPAERAPQGDQAAAADGADSLTERLERCRGILVPPKIGDAEMTAPPPDAGETPVIRPEDLPPQDSQEPRAQ